MRNIKHLLLLATGVFLLTSCAGIQTLTIQTQEPAQVTLPTKVEKLLVVDNTANQPFDIGHTKMQLGRKQAEKVSVRTDSLSLIYTEALTQFLNEEGFYDIVMLHNEPMRTDSEYWREDPIAPEKMQKLKEASGADAVVSLDKLLIASDWEDMFLQQGYPYTTEAMVSARVAYDRTSYSFEELPEIYQNLASAVMIGEVFYSGHHIYGYHELGLGKLIYSLSREDRKSVV